MHLMLTDKRPSKAAAGQHGFTLLEAAISLVVLMVIGLGVASLFAYAVSANAKADDRELAMAVAQERMEWLRTIPFTTQTRNVAYAYVQGGLQATDEDGVTDTVFSAGRTYTVVTIIEDLSFVPDGDPDEDATTLKRIQVSVTPQYGNNFDTITLTTLRSTQVPGIY
jgi:type II secretory pathway pseudopilin PulG